MAEYIYCISCMASSDAIVAKTIEQMLHIRAISLCFDREEHRNGQWIVKTYPLLWGYVFLYSDQPIDIMQVHEIEHVNRVLQYGDGECNLHGDDRKFAEWVLKYNGQIGLSKALLVGDRTKIIEGPLKEYEGVIRRINRQKGSALVDITIGDTVKPTWLYFQWMTTRDGQLVKLRDEQIRS